MFRSIRVPVASLLVLVALGGVALASRNSTGTYSLPTGNPVVPGTTISSSWANGTLSDISTELTNSLDRNGRGAMLAPLQHTSGSVTSPSLTFSAEPGSGVYRAGTNDVRMSVNQSDVQKWNAGSTTVSGNASVTGTLGVSGAATLSSTLGVTSTSTLSGLVTANAGINASIALPTSGTVFPTGNNISIPLTATTSGNDYPIGSFRTSVPTNVLGLTVRQKNVTTVTSWPNVALGMTLDVDASEGAGGGFWLSNGKFLLGANAASPVLKVDTQTTNPTSTTAESNTVTGKNTVKVWAHLSGTAVADGFNVASTSCAANLLTITFASAFSSSSFSATWSTVTTSGAGYFIVENGRSTTTLVLQMMSTSWTTQNICTLLSQLDLQVIGPQ